MSAGPNLKLLRYKTFYKEHLPLLRDDKSVNTPWTVMSSIGFTMSAGPNSVALLFSFDPASSAMTGSAAATLAFAVPTSAVGSCSQQALFRYRYPQLPSQH